MLLPNTASDVWSTALLAAFTTTWLFSAGTSVEGITLEKNEEVITNSAQEAKKVSFFIRVVFYSIKDSYCLCLLPAYYRPFIIANYTVCFLKLYADLINTGSKPTIKAQLFQ
jgi:hypothetical protein